MEKGKWKLGRGVPPTRVFWEKSLELFENKGVVIFRHAKEFAIISKQRR